MPSSLIFNQIRPVESNLEISQLIHNVWALYLSIYLSKCWLHEPLLFIIQGDAKNEREKKCECFNLNISRLRLEECN